MMPSMTAANLVSGARTKETHWARQADWMSGVLNVAKSDGDTTPPRALASHPDRIAAKRGERNQKSDQSRG